MALKIEFSNLYKKDFTKAVRQHKDMSKLLNLVSLLASKETLPINYDNHKLEGKFEGFMECHIEPDWLLMYYFKEDKKCIVFYRMGSHSELFG